MLLWIFVVLVSFEINVCVVFRYIPRSGIAGSCGRYTFSYLKNLHTILCFPGGSDGKVSACNGGDLSSIPGLGRSPGEKNDNPLQYSCLENPMDGGTWQATVHGVAKSRTWLSNFTVTFFFSILCYTVVGTIFISTNISQGLPFFHILLNICYF